MGPSSLSHDVDQQAMSADITTLVSALDPNKVWANSNRALDMLTDRGLTHTDILQREIAAVLLENVRAVLGDDLWLPPEQRFFYTNQAEGTSLEIADDFGRKCVAMFNAQLAEGVDRISAKSAVVTYLESLIVQTLSPPSFTFSERRVLYPASHAVFCLRGPISAAIYGITRPRVLAVMAQVRDIHYRAFQETSKSSDRKELISTTEFVSKWIAEKFLPKD